MSGSGVAPVQWLDGGMGTQLIERGMAPGECAERWNVDRTADVATIHQAYADAGCGWVTTNTFGAHPMALARHGGEEETEALVRAAVRVARGSGARVLGDLGPFGDFLSPYGAAEPEDVAAGFDRVALVMALAGVDGFVVETMADPAEAILAVAAARRAAPDVPVLATFSFLRRGSEFRTWTGATVAEAMDAVRDAGASVVGTNCGTQLDLSDYLRLADELLGAAKGLPVVVQANAGAPEVSPGGSVHYSVGPAEFAVFTQELRAIGVTWIGGCCGTTPAHLAAATNRAVTA